VIDNAKRKRIGPAENANQTGTNAESIAGIANIAVAK
jgi:hypothetical protein